jgi:hypothetical protein
MAGAYPSVEGGPCIVGGAVVSRMHKKEWEKLLACCGRNLKLLLACFCRAFSLENRLKDTDF